jgi:2-amino-4-hydroxy-6-hydroxymethyldihydropteridine diphosphokinase
VTQVLVAAGSNVAPVDNLHRALDVLARHYPDLRCSRAYRNRAVGFDGDDFVNLVVAFDTDDDLCSVIERLHEAEAACGRARDAPRWAPRSMDLDILLYGSLVLDEREEWRLTPNRPNREEPGLTLPRPDLTRRAYMLGPAAELAPDFVHPLLGATLRELWRRFDQRLHPLHEVDLGWRPQGRAG